MTESGNTPSGGAPRRGRGLKLSIAALVLAGSAVLWVGLTVDRTPGARSTRAAEAGLRGSVLPEPAPKPVFTLTDTEGRAFDFATATEGRLTLLFFGFTHCPDICPVHLANLAAVLRDQRPEVRQQVSVIFITGDPARDTPERLREWLDAFDPSFVGLYGTIDEVNAILSELRLAPVVHGPADERGGYSVGHPAQILAFTPDGWLRVMYPFGTRQADWAHDLPRLAGFTAPPDAPSAVALLRASQAFVPAPAGDGPAALYLTVANRATFADTLVGGSADIAGAVEVHRHVQRDGAAMMERVAGAPVEPRDSLALVPGGTHVMLRDLKRLLVVGDTFTVRLQFQRAGTLAVKAVVVPYAALESMLGNTSHADH